ncbi:magnesium transporter [Neochlamydia sp. EPS4]|jgi:magnesium transporter|uniref:magnesium transporter n=1 Tax=Neochlamydia sp. EPS4 TaxID=1478175 RepID=UPI0005D103C0|nr:magnesium transporter [Neochlamydia sp. EPS4]
MKVSPLTSLNHLIKDKKDQELQESLKSLSGFEIADLIEKKTMPDRLFVFTLLSPQQAAETFDYLSDKQKKQILRSLSSTQIASMLTAMRSDDRTALLEELPQQVVEDYLKLLPPEQRLETLTLLGYPEDSVGRLITTDYIAVKMNWSIEQVFDYIREYGKDSETIDVIYVVDDAGILIDDLRLKEILFHPKEYKIAQITDQKFLALSVHDAAEEAINLFKEYNRVALPVINDEGVLLGIVTIDDILRLASEENTNEVHKIGGSDALDEPYLETPFFELIKKRARWLVILFVGEMFTATAMGFFENQISRAVVLALFLPLIISSGGNAGSQSSTLIIRAMALGEVKLKDWWNIMRGEFLLGASLGLVLGVVGFIRVSLWGTLGHVYGEHWFLMAVTIFFSLIGVVLWGSLSGAMLPFVLRRLGFDPATSSAPLVATIVDVVGIVIYFTLAMVILKGSLL